MEFDWSESPLTTNGAPTQQQVEESFEDPHGIRLFPDSGRFARESRIFCLGKTLSGQGIFAVFRSDGKRIRVISARPFTSEEGYFYERKVSEWTS